MPAHWQNTFSDSSWIGRILTQPNAATPGSLPDSPLGLVQAQIKQPDLGVLQFEPDKSATSSLILSCGIHGNETAPIELIGQIVEDIFSGDLAVGARLLIILGHPPAAEAGKRFLEVNLNRLFGPSETLPDNYEVRRAKALKAIIDSFLKQQSHQCYHLDLHTAIRSSHFEKFAVSPFGQTLNPTTIELLGAMGIEAILQSHQPASTFSHYSFAAANATAFTLELGKVEDFGNNDLSRIAAADNTLRAMVQGLRPTTTPTRESEPPVRFRVVKELLRVSEDYELLIEADTANFTPYPTNTLIARNAESEYRTVYPNEHIVFPNPEVPVGQRAGLMVIKI